MTTNVNIVALGTVAHGDYVRRIAARIPAVVRLAENVYDTVSFIQDKICDVVVAELPFGDVDSDELLALVRESCPDCLTIFRIPAGCVGDAVDLARRGAYSCLDERTRDEAASDILGRAVEEVCSRRGSRVHENEGWRRMLVGDSPEMQDVARMIQLVAMRRCTVLISGETGTGKEMCARAIHAASDRAKKPMVALNCSAIPEHLLEAELFGHTRGAFTGAINDRAGRFEEANDGTLFLDEIGDMPFDLQAKLLRVLQEREIQRLGSSKTIKVNVRIIAASNLDLLDRVKQGRFREDLYYRLNVVPIQMPALRDRRGDVALLARHFVAKVCRLEDMEQKEIYNETLAKLASCDWPGNVRQLENMIERAVVISGSRNFLVPADFPLAAGTSRPLPQKVRPETISVPDHGIDFTQVVTVFERNLVDQALTKAKGNKSFAADLLGLKRSTLISKLRVFEQVAA
ncbi:MAG TPA: sigma-54 dependent transcriptional regulator [Bryobacteraceae bacterium]|nr:sigma-54 dependent transcriptional regulator [Bryobacteraceae bacterium]